MEQPKRLKMDENGECLLIMMLMRCLLVESGEYVLISLPTTTRFVVEG